MASSNKTTYYNLPQFIGTDKPSWISDINPAMADIDIAINQAQAKANEEITNERLANNAVTTNKIENSSITNDKIAGNTITSEKLADGSISTNKIGDGAIATAKIADNAIVGGKIANNTITGAKIENTSITSNKIDYSSVTLSDYSELKNSDFTQNYDNTWTINDLSVIYIYGLGYSYEGNPDIEVYLNDITVGSIRRDSNVGEFSGSSLTIIAPKGSKLRVVSRGGGQLGWVRQFKIG